MEQLVARWAHNPKVVSSSLALATTKKPKDQIFRLFYFVKSVFAINNCFFQFSKPYNFLTLRTINSRSQKIDEYTKG